MKLSKTIFTSILFVYSISLYAAPLRIANTTNNPPDTMEAVEPANTSDQPKLLGAQVKPEQSVQELVKKVESAQDDYDSWEATQQRPIGIILEYLRSPEYQNFSNLLDEEQELKEEKELYHLAKILQDPGMSNDAEKSKTELEKMNGYSQWASQHPEAAQAPIEQVTLNFGQYLVGLEEAAYAKLIPLQAQAKEEFSAWRNAQPQWQELQKTLQSAKEQAALLGITLDNQLYGGNDVGEKTRKAITTAAINAGLISEDSLSEDSSSRIKDR